RVVAALDDRAQADEPVALVAQHPPDRTLEAADLGLELLDEVQRRLLAAGPAAVAHDRPGAVDRLPHLGAERGSRRQRVVARCGEAGAERGRRPLGEGEVASRGGDAERLAAGGEFLLHTDDAEGAAPGALARFRAAERIRPHRGLDQPASELGPLHVAAEPVEMAGGARQHQAVPPSGAGARTRLSLVPPPWLELTTSEPLRSATRVSPPGTIRTPSAPVSTNGRKSTWRGAMPPSTSVGPVESAS